MINTRQIVFSSVLLCIIIAFIIVGITVSNNREALIDSAVSETLSIDEKPEVPPPEKYVLKIEDGVVVVFNETDMTRPIIVTDIYAGTLRHFDREQLLCGITAVGEFELSALLEDFSS